VQNKVHCVLQIVYFVHLSKYYVKDSKNVVTFCFSYVDIYCAVKLDSSKSGSDSVIQSLILLYDIDWWVAACISTPPCLV